MRHPMLLYKLMIINVLEITLLLLSQILLFADIKKVSQELQCSKNEQPLSHFLYIFPWMLFAQLEAPWRLEFPLHSSL